MLPVFPVWRGEALSGGRTRISRRLETVASAGGFGGGSDDVVERDML